ncbi:MAG: hypothetical protein MMC23_002936 [Stictis urceolatum]|nr:hypothetical protein [Stictis urceolata]
MAKRKHTSDDESAPIGLSKKVKATPAASSLSAVADKFRVGMFDDPAQLQLLKEQYSRSKPYKHGVLYDLIDDDLLRGVLNEVKTQIEFTEKETDIYRIFQSGDLANLDGLDPALLSRLPSLLKLRNALYSAPFRDYLSTITGSGPLSGSKTDMAVNIYKPGCHLLCHDDVIGSRRVSYILYLTEEWDHRWGGALRLYPTTVHLNSKGHKVHVPSPDHTVKIPPRWNQMSYFAVQPGESYHDVEEVYPQGYRTNDDLISPNSKRIRIAISGWYHIPQSGEAGYKAGVEEQIAKKSSLTQLKSNDTQFDFPENYPIPYPCYPFSAPQFIDPNSPIFERMKKMGYKLGPTGGSPAKPLQEDYAWDALTASDCDFLLQFMNPYLLDPSRVRAVNEEFSSEQSIIITPFLHPKTFGPALKAAIQQEAKTLSSSASKVTKESLWEAAQPPHKRRFLYILPTEGDPNKQNLLTTKDAPASPIKQLLCEFLSSMQFRKWLGFATGLIARSHDLKARRFRRGMDYQLATAYENEEPRLELTLGLTPEGVWEADLPEKEGGDGNEGGREEEGIEAVHNGGEECYMAPMEDDAPEPSSDEDMASDSSSDSSLTSAYSSDSDTGPSGRPKRRIPKKKHPMPPKPAKASSSKNKDLKADPAVYKSSATDEEDMLFHMAAGWNRLSLVTRDTGTLKYVRFVNTAAGADRWDVTGDYEVDWKKTDEVELEGWEGAGDEEGEEGERGEEGEGGDEEEWEGLGDVEEEGGEKEGEEEVAGEVAGAVKAEV